MFFTFNRLSRKTFILPLRFELVNVHYHRSISLLANNKAWRTSPMKAENIR